MLMREILLSETLRHSSFAQSAATRGGKVAEFVMIETGCRVTVPQQLSTIREESK